VNSPQTRPEDLNGLPKAIKKRVARTLANGSDPFQGIMRRREMRVQGQSATVPD